MMLIYKGFRPSRLSKSLNMTEPVQIQECRQVSSSFKETLRVKKILT